MRSKFFAVFGCCLLMLTCFSGAATVSAQDANNIAGEVSSLVGGIEAYKEAESGVNSIQEWIDTDLVKNAGATSEWYVMGLSQTGESYDFSAYYSALKKYLSEDTISGAVTRQKYALALTAIGHADDEFVTSTVEDAIGQQGIMSWVFGLNLYNNGCVNKSTTYTADQIITEILNLRFSDGGWALTGTVSDIDVTAMTIQALSPYYSKNETVKTALDGAIAYLSGKQLDNGGYMGFGTENPESPAQVIVALSALGIDCSTDSRFIKNGHTLIDGMLAYRLADGSFAHVKGGVYNHNATVQVYYALIAFQRQQKGLGPLLVFDSPIQPEPQQEPASALTGYKFWLSISAAGLALMICVVLIFMKKTHLKNFIAVLLATAAVIAFVQLTDFSAASNYYNGKDAEKGAIIGTVTLTIRCDTIIGKSDSKYIPADGVILPVTEFEIEDGDSAYDVLVEATRKYNIQMENSGSALGIAYISGINYLYEFQFGDLSGWVYHVNGVAPSVGCEEFALSDGDVIECLYTCELGNDLD